MLSQPSGFTPLQPSRFVILSVALAVLVAPFVYGGCSTKAVQNPAEGNPAGSAATQSASAAPVEPPAAASASDAGAPDSGAQAALTAPTPEAAPTASGSPEAPGAGEPLPKVKVVNIGMHVGGGKNDAAEKDPIRRSVEPHFDELRRCFARVEDPKKGGDFGMDLRIDKDGGKAKVSHPRTALKGKDFEDCVIKVFEAIDFRKPKGGTTVVSYSLRFTPEES